MATTGSRAGKAFAEILSDALIALGTNILFKKFVEATAEKGAEIAKARWQRKEELEKIRREVLDDLRLLENTFPGSVDNIWKRYDQAKAKFQENRFVDNLGKAPDEPGFGRRRTLLWLNNLDEDQFQAAMGFLENDYIMEALQKAWSAGGRLTKQSLQALQGAFSKACHQLGVVSEKAKERVDNAAGGLAMGLTQVTDWLNQTGRQGGRRRRP